MKIHPTQLTPVLRTNQLEETTAFYCNVLGFTCNEKNDDWGWASLSAGDITLMLAKPNEHEPFENAKFTGSFYFRVPNVDEAWNHLKDRVSVCYAPEDFPWEMREFAIYDNNGYLLQFGQENTN